MVKRGEKVIRNGSGRIEDEGKTKKRHDGSNVWKRIREKMNISEGTVYNREEREREIHKLSNSVRNKDIKQRR